MCIKWWARIPWPCTITATWRRHNPSNQQQHTFQWNPHSHRLETSRQRRIAAIEVPVRKSGALQHTHLLIRSCKRETISIAFVNNHMCIYPHILMNSMHFHYINPFNKRQVNEFADPFKNLCITGSHQISKLINRKHLFHIWIHT